LQNYIAKGQPDGGEGTDARKFGIPHLAREGDRNKGSKNFAWFQEEDVVNNSRVDTTKTKGRDVNHREIRRGYTYNLKDLG